MRQAHDRLWRLRALIFAAVPLIFYFSFMAWYASPIFIIPTIILGSIVCGAVCYTASSQESPHDGE